MNPTVEHLQEAWARARAGRGAVVHLLAPVGLGRSTLLARFLETVESSDRAAVVSAQCAEDVSPDAHRGIVEDLVVRVAEGLRAIEASNAAEGPHDEVPWLLPGADFLAAATDIASLPPVPGTPPLVREHIYADLLLDVARERPVLMVLDDAHRADEASRRLVELLAVTLREQPAYKLLLVLSSAPPLASGRKPWLPDPKAVVALPPLPRDALEEQIRGRLARFGRPAPAYVERLAEAARGNLLVLDALIHVSEQAGALSRKGAVDDPALPRRPELAALAALAEGRLPELPPPLRDDLGAAAVAGARFEVGLLATLWDVPEADAAARVEAMRHTGLVQGRGDRGRFLSPELAAHFADALTETHRVALEARLGALLRTSGRMAAAAAESKGLHLDVTETWSETRRRAGRLDEALDQLEAASRHFARAGRHLAAAEAAVTLVERLFEAGGGHSYLAGRFGRRADRERRHRIYAALNHAASQLDRARGTRDAGDGVDPELLSVDIRLLAARARFKQILGDFAEAREAADTAVEVAAHLPGSERRLEALRVRLEVCYAAGDNNAARQALVRLLAELGRGPREARVRIYGWLAEAVSRWEWIGLHDRLYPLILEPLHALGAHRAAIKARVERLAAAIEVDDAAAEVLLVDAVDAAGAHGQVAYLAEILALYAADLIQGQVEAHYDSLSGEFYPPDLYGDGVGPPTVSLPERLARPVDLLTRAELMAEESDNRVASLRVLTTVLGVIYEARERFLDLLDRWMPVHQDATPIRLAELVDTLDQGFFDVDHIEALSERTLLLAQSLGLDQVVADTIYEALDRELPGATRRAHTLFEVAREAYRRVGDVYGLITLDLVEVRHREQRSEDPTPPLESAVRALETGADHLAADQRAFVHLRLGRRLLDEGKLDEAAFHLEQAIRLYDQVGDVEQVQAVGEMLQEVYRKLGDLGRYRVLRERYRALERRAPGTDPLGLEFRIEHLLTLARQEADDERAIEMVERCVQLFGRVPDGTARIDECFVEISKICRRRADEAQTEPGFHEWLRRSLEAVQTASSINRALSNFHRVFEESHELFDDLLGLGAIEEYLQARAASRELAFAVGNVAELLYLFEEHLRYDPELGYDPGRLPEVRGFYEALVRYVLGLGALEQALTVQRNFVRFLNEIGEPDLAEVYQERRLVN